MNDNDWVDILAMIFSILAVLIATGILPAIVAIIAQLT